MHPELSFNEFETANFVDGKLKELGLETSRLAKTGIVSLMKGQAGEGRVVGLRADMDALPILEKNEVPYKSQNNGVMHACGHDVHTTCLLGAVAILQQNMPQLAGQIKCVFQPGEELIPGGASLMIKEGVLRQPDVELMFGQHVYPDFEAGHIGIKPGMYMASADEIRMTVKGRGGHAAMPNKNADPVVMAASLILELQKVVSRLANPTTPTVLSFGKIIADGATNVIPDEVYIEGTFRTLDETWRKQAHEAIRKVGTSLVESWGGKLDLDIAVGYPFLTNHEKLTQFAFREASSLLGQDKVHEIETRMTAEDFAYFSQAVPATFYRLGVASQKRGITHPVHSAHFDIEEEALVTGAATMAWLAIRALETNPLAQ